MEWGKLTKVQADQLSKDELTWMSTRYKQLSNTTHKGRAASAAEVVREEVKVKRGWSEEPNPSRGKLPIQPLYPTINQSRGDMKKEYIKLQKGGRRLVRYGKRGGKYYMKGGQKIYIK